MHLPASISQTRTSSVYQSVLKFAIFLVACCGHHCWANGLKDLEVFLTTARTGSARFVQQVTIPAKEGQAPRVRSSSGSFEFDRPGRFRFVYNKPFEQVIVADGQVLWLHDVDLNQVSQRAQAQVLSSTPAALLIQGGGLEALRAQYTLTHASDADGMQWAQAEPKSRDGAIQRVRVGFKSGQLAALEFTDSFGQVSRMGFTDVVANGPMPADRFKFVPPTGAVVVRQ